MSFLLDLLGALGLGGQIIVAATLLVGAFYLRRGVGVLQTTVAVVSSSAGTAAVILVAVGVAIAAGWVDPNVATVQSHFNAAVGAVREFVVNRLQGVVP